MKKTSMILWDMICIVNHIYVAWKWHEMTDFPTSHGHVYGMFMGTFSWCQRYRYGRIMCVCFFFKGHDSMMTWSINGWCWLMLHLSMGFDWRRYMKDLLILVWKCRTPCPSRHKHRETDNMISISITCSTCSWEIMGRLMQCIANSLTNCPTWSDWPYEAWGQGDLGAAPARSFSSPMSYFTESNSCERLSRPGAAKDQRQQFAPLKLKPLVT